MDKYKNSEFFILGDYNLRDTLWSNYGEIFDNLLAVSYPSDNLVQGNSTLLMNMFSFFGMSKFFPLHP